MNAHFLKKEKIHTDRPKQFAKVILEAQGVRS